MCVVTGRDWVQLQAPAETVRISGHNGTGSLLKCRRLKPDPHTHTMSFPCREPTATLPRPCNYPNAGRSPTCRLRTADANSHIPCRSHAALCRGLARSLSEWNIRGMAGERHGTATACLNQTRPHCINQMGNTLSKPLTERQGRGTAWYMWISLKSFLKFPVQQNDVGVPLLIYMRNSLVPISTGASAWGSAVTHGLCTQVPGVYIN
jgi:hypothetical protein